MFINIPGLRNSSEHHWQSIWERTHPEQFMRVLQENWSEPECEKWIVQMECQLTDLSKEELILVGHSIGCMTIVHWLNRYKHVVKGVLLVAPSDADKPGFPDYIKGFSPIPVNALGVPGIVVASTNDHVTSLERSRFFAEQWNCELIVLDEAGHIEPQSGFGSWEEGKLLLQKLNGSALPHSF